MTCPSPRPPRRPPPQHGALNAGTTVRQLKALAHVHEHPLAFKRAPGAHLVEVLRFTLAVQEGATP